MNIIKRIKQISISISINKNYRIFKRKFWYWGPGVTQFQKDQYKNSLGHRILHATEREVGFWKCMVIIHYPSFFEKTNDAVFMGKFISKFSKSLQEINPNLEYFGYFNGKIQMFLNKEYTKEEFDTLLYRINTLSRVTGFLKNPLALDLYSELLFSYTCYIKIDIVPYRDGSQLFYENGTWSIGSFFYNPSLVRFLKV